MTLKQKIHGQYLQLVNDKVQSLQQVLADLKESGANETKSTAGDKHETALAMIQIEQANIRAQLKEALDQKAALEKINPVVSSNSIVNGSLVKTNRGYMFLSVALGKLVTGGIRVIAVSQQSPVGLLLTGMHAGETRVINGNPYIVESIE